MRILHIPAVALSAGCLFLFFPFAGRTLAQQPCSVRLPLQAPSAMNIFSIQQERILGDIEAEWVESSYPTTQDADLESHLSAVAGRVLPQLPSDRTEVRVILIDKPDAEAFSVGPARIYITRKMIALLKNDDELAGLLGHELGHILVHENAVTVSRLFQEILGVNTVSDRKDITDKLRRILSAADRNAASSKAARLVAAGEGNLENQADRVAVYALAAAGFSPQAYAELFDRSAGTNGSGGNSLTDFLGATSSDQRRLREIRKALKRLPSSCRQRMPVASAEFHSWQAAVMSQPGFDLPALDAGRKESRETLAGQGNK
jgi:predicted Zn-dependent protease